MVDSRVIVRAPLLEPSPLTPYRSSVAERREVDERYVLYSEGSDNIDANFAAVFGPLTVDDFFVAARRVYGDAEFAVLIESDTGKTIEKHLQDGGWTLDEEEVAMVLSPIPAAPEPHPELHILRVTTERDYEDFMQVVPGNRDWVPSLAAATDPNVALFAGYVDTEPVTTARLVGYRAICEITAVTTIESHRRRGYGQALTWAAIGEAQRRGYSAITLTATEMGYPLYRGMGFETVCSYRTYLPAGST